MTHEADMRMLAKIIEGQKAFRTRLETVRPIRFARLKRWLGW